MSTMKTNAFAKWLGYTIARFRFSFRDGVDACHTQRYQSEKEAEVRAVLVEDLVKNYIPAIKLYRQHFGASLKIAKDAVDRMRAHAGYVPEMRR